MSDRFDAKPSVKGRRLNVLPPNPQSGNQEGVVKTGRFPQWLHRKMPKGGGLKQTDAILADLRLPTVCEEAKCPNLLECWSKKTATFLAMGSACTRACGFCDIDFNAKPLPLQPDEPERISKSVKALGLQHVVITMVARDDLPDGGACHLAEIIRQVRNTNPGSTIEVLTSDFAGNKEALDIVMDTKPEIFNHNIETVRELTPRVRHKASYERTLATLKYVSEKKSVRVKSGLMLGLGESEEQVKETLQDLKEVGCSIVTLGQYLQASRHKLRVKAFITPEQFQELEIYAKEKVGFKHVYSAPFVRSSYNAAALFEEVKAL